MIGLDIGSLVDNENVVTIQVAVDVNSVRFRNSTIALHPKPRIIRYQTPAAAPTESMFVRDKFAPIFLEQQQEYIPASGTHISVSRIIDIYIIHTCIRVKDRGL